MIKRLLFLILALPCYGANYYVTQSGTGQANGSSVANAWSVGSFNSSTVPKPGDTVFFSGTITSQIVENVSGAAGSPITLNLTGATVNGPGGTGSYIVNNGQSYVTYLGGFLGPNATNSSNGNTNPANGSGNGGPFIIDLSATNVVCHDITISGFIYAGGKYDTPIFVYARYVYNLTISGNNIINGGQFVIGLNSNCHDWQILNNSFISSLNCFTQQDVIAIGDAYNVTIQGNMLVNHSPNNQSEPAANYAHNDVIQTFTSGSTPHAAPYNWVVRYNWICNNSQPTSDGSGSWMMMENMTGNAAYIYGNVFIDPSNTANTNEGVVFDSCAAGTNVWFHNNTVIAHGMPAAVVLYFLNGTSPNTVYAENNVCEADTPNSIGTFINSTFVNNWSHNLFANWALPSGSWGTSVGMGMSDPFFVQYAGSGQTPPGYNYSSRTGSPLIVVGDSTIGATYNQGLAPGATWPNPALSWRTAGNWDVGAYQSAPKPSPTPTATPTPSPSPTPTPSPTPSPTPTPTPTPSPTPVMFQAVVTISGNPPTITIVPIPLPAN